MPTANTTLTGVLAEHVRAVNAFDTDAVVATIAEDAFINDVSREIRGLGSIRAFVAKEIVGDNVTMDVTKSSITTATRSFAPRMTATTTRPTSQTR